MFLSNIDKEKLYENLGYYFNNTDLLIQALTRTSAANEKRQGTILQDYQRLEFLGDRVLNLIIADILYQQYPDFREGNLTIKLSTFVNNKSPLTKIAKILQLQHSLIVGQDEQRRRVQEKTKVLSDAMEALIGAIWLDSGKNYNVMYHFILKHWRHVGLTFGDNPVIPKKIFTQMLSNTSAEEKTIKQHSFCKFGFTSICFPLHSIKNSHSTKSRATNPMSL